jgi:hypothetical protein
MRVSLLSLVALAALPSGALAQSLTGAIGGNVKDPQAAPVPGAGVSLVGRTRTLRTTTDRAGDYRFLAIEPGTYSVRVDVAGFKPQQRDTIAIHPGVLLTLDFLLSLGAMSDSIEVIAESPVVDVRNSEFRIGLTQDQLYNLPFARDSNGLRDALPGINGRSAFGAVPNGNALYLDGVDTRDPQNADFWLHVNYNLLQEVQVEGPGAPAEFGAYTGVVVNAITRSGGNSISGLFDARYSWSSLASNNVDAGIAAQNPGLGDPAVTTDLVDLTGQLGGPIRRDRLFFMLNGQHSVLDTDPSGPRSSEKRRDERWNGKLTWEPRPQDHVALSLQWDRRRELNNGQPTDTDAISSDSNRPEWIWGLQWRRTLGTQSFLDARYLGWTTTARQTPQAYVPAHLDVATGEKTGSWGVWSQTNQARHQVSLSLTHYAEAYGRHELKFGVEIERGKVRDQFGGAGQPPVYYIDYGGLPYFAYEYGFDATGYTHRQTAYAQDGWRATDRLTLNLGVRLDLYQGRNDTDTVWETHGLAPRLGLAWDVTGDHATVARASFARHYETLPVWDYFPALHGIEDFIVYSNTGSELVEIARLHKGDATVDSEIQHPRVDEFALGIERAVGGDLRVSLTGMKRRTSNFFDALHEGAQYAPNTMTNPLTGLPLTVYDIVDPTVLNQPAFITNVDGRPYFDAEGDLIASAEAFRSYTGLMLVASRRLRGRWQAQVTYVLAQAEGTVDNGPYDALGPFEQGVYDSANNALVNAQGRMTNDYRHELKLLSSYRIPRIELGLSAFYRFVSGTTYTPTSRTPPTGEVRLEPLGSRRLPSRSVLDLRIEKTIRVGRGRIGVYADITNVFNASTTTTAQASVPSASVAGHDVAFGAPLEILPARQAILGARWSF